MRGERNRNGTHAYEALPCAALCHHLTGRHPRKRSRYHDGRAPDSDGGEHAQHASRAVHQGTPGECAVRRETDAGTLDDARRADIAREFQHAIVDVLVAKALAALDSTGSTRLVVAGGVGANRELRERLTAAVSRRGAEVYFPDLEFCTDNGAMIALVGALRLRGAQRDVYAFSVRPRWDLASLPAASIAVGER